MDADPCGLVNKSNLNERLRVNKFQAQNQITT
jgi:hypothetical protein